MSNFCFEPSAVKLKIQVKCIFIAKVCNLVPFYNKCLIVPLVQQQDVPLM